MLNNRQKPGHAGFTLIELMIGIAILAILVGLAMPSFRIMMRNTEIRNAAESVLNGLQRARAEAVARNTNVTFVLATNSAWTINVVTPASTIESRLANEGSPNVTRTVLPLGATTITYNNVGQVVANANGTATLTQVDMNATEAADRNRTLRITIGSTSGTAKMCDPALTSGPRAC